MAQLWFLVCHLEFSSSSSILLLCVELLRKGSRYYLTKISLLLEKKSLVHMIPVFCNSNVGSSTLNKSNNVVPHLYQLCLAGFYSLVSCGVLLAFLGCQYRTKSWLLCVSTYGCASSSTHIHTEYTVCQENLHLTLMFFLIWRKCGNSFRFKKSLSEELPEFEANPVCEKLFVLRRREAADSCAGAFAGSSVAVLPVLPVTQRHSVVVFWVTVVRNTGQTPHGSEAEAESRTLS